MENIKIRQGTIEEALRVSDQIPEFLDGYGKEEYKFRLENKLNLILIAEDGDKAVGFKVGYQTDDYFYSWVGGVVPEYRRSGVAKKLSDFLEQWVKEKGISVVRFKTQNKFKHMLIFALKNGFSIIGTVPFDRDEGFKVLLEKKL